MLKRFCNVLVFMVLTFEDELCFSGRWETPWRYFYQALTAPLPVIRLWVFDGLVLGMLVSVYAKKSARANRARQLDSAILLSLAAALAWGLYGLSQGGNAIQMRLQLHTHVMMLLTGLLFIGVYRTKQDFVALGRIIVYAALFRFLMALAFYILIVRMRGVFVEYVLDHGDTMLLTMAFAIALAHAIHTRSRGAVVRALAIMVAMLWCIQINNRRIAWVSLIGAIIVIYFLASAGSARRRLHRAISIAIPVLVIYVTVGWGRPERIFRPLASLQTMGDTDVKDMSTESRNLENLGLVKTLNSAPWLGTGFGHEYLEVSDALAPKLVFPMYRYNPHNSVLGLAAFMGGVGFFAVWLVFPMTVYFGARAYRLARTPDERSIAVCACAAVIVHINQLYADIGINSTQTLVLMPVALAAASRLATATAVAAGTKRTEAAPTPKALPSATERSIWTKSD